MNRTSFAKAFPQKLNAELDRRKRKNPNYSLRAFAQFIGLPKSTLAALMSGERLPIRSTLQKIGRACDWPADELQMMQSDLAELRKTTVKARRMTPFNNADGELLADVLTLALRRWASRPDCSADPAKLARELGTTTDRIRRSLEILERRKLVQRSGATLKMSEDAHGFIDAPNNPEMRRYVRTILQQAIDYNGDPKVPRKHFIFGFLPMNMKDEPRLLHKMNTFFRSLSRDFPPDEANKLFTLALTYFPFSAEE